MRALVKAYGVKAWKTLSQAVCISFRGLSSENLNPSAGTPPPRRRHLRHPWSFLYAETPNRTVKAYRGNMETPENHNVPFGGLSSENLNPGAGTSSSPLTAHLPVSIFSLATSLPASAFSLAVDSSTAAAAANPAPSAAASLPLELPSCAGSLVGCATALTQRSLGKSLSRSSSRKTVRRRATIISGRTVSPHFEKHAYSV